MTLCVFPNCDRPARKHGVECRTHYLRAKKRESREGKPREIPEDLPMSLEDVTYLLDKRSYQDWYNSQ